MWVNMEVEAEKMPMVCLGEGKGDDHSLEREKGARERTQMAKCLPASKMTRHGPPEATFKEEPGLGLKRWLSGEVLSLC